MGYPRHTLIVRICGFALSIFRDPCLLLCLLCGLSIENGAIGTDDTRRSDSVCRVPLEDALINESKDRISYVIFKGC